MTIYVEQFRIFQKITLLLCLKEEVMSEEVMQPHNQSKEELLKEFLEKWTLDKVNNMTLEEYTSTSSNNRIDFCSC